MKDYYEILQVHRSATETEIKKAYRRLAIRFHPDKNRALEAEVIFKEINEAYETLGDPQRKYLYDERLTGVRSDAGSDRAQPEQRRHRDPAYRRKKHPPTYKSEKERLREAMLKLLPWANRITYFSAVVAAILFIDFALPPASSVEMITSSDFKVSYTSSRRRYSRSYVDSWVVKTDQGRSMEVDYEVSKFLKPSSRIIVNVSRILEVPRSIVADEHIPIRKSLYGSFIFAPVALLLTSCFGLYFRRHVEYAFNAGLVCVLLLGLTFTVYVLIH